MAANLATQTKKSIKWEEQHENCLIELWEENIDALRSQQRNSHIYARIAEQLKLHGLSEVTGKDVKTKVDNMSRKFRLEMKITGPSGGAPSEWKHFDRLKRFLGCVKSINPIAFESTEDNGAAKETPEFVMFDEDSGIISGASSSSFHEELLEQNMERNAALTALANIQHVAATAEAVEAVADAVESDLATADTFVA